MKRVKFYIPALLILTSAISNSTFAHNSLEASTPAAGQSLSEGPEFIELTFVDAT